MAAPASRALAEHVAPRDAGALFRGLLARLPDAPCDAAAATAAIDAAAAGIVAVLAAAPTSSHDALADEFVEAFASAALVAGPVAQQQSAVLKHLTLKRSTDASRMEISTHAEAFAALIAIGFINIAGAVTTILAHLRKRENLRRNHNAGQDRRALPAAELATTLRAITEDVYQYNIIYVESMGWTRQRVATSLAAVAELHHKSKPSLTASSRPLAPPGAH
eukprot:SM000086S23070  [mRNA]  locus=s86:453754:455162:+ [translate_table: standard]